MAKVSKEGFTKEQWKAFKLERKKQKELARQKKLKKTEQVNIVPETVNSEIAFVVGNGVSRSNIDLHKLQKIGKIYGCNALYRSFAPDYLIAVDVKMIIEINKTGWQNKHTVWTNPNRSYERMKGFNFFTPSKGWSSGPTALWLASQHRYHKIFILGFDYKGLDNGQKFNNIYADTNNYKKSSDTATFYGNWLRQTKTVIQEHKNISYFRVIDLDTFCPEELNRFQNFQNLPKNQFMDLFQLHN